MTELNDLIKPETADLIERKVDNIFLWGDHEGAIRNIMEEPFYYLAGKMSGIPAFNFPAFDHHAAVLRASGYNIISPAELDHEKEREAAMASPDGKHAPGDNIKSWVDCLRRDLEYVLHHNCQGVIAFGKWWDSAGARWETDAAQRAGKPILELSLYPSQPRIREMRKISRDLTLAGYNKLSDVPMNQLATAAGLVLIPPNEGAPS